MNTKKSLNMLLFMALAALTLSCGGRNARKQHEEAAAAAAAELKGLPPSIAPPGATPAAGPYSTAVTVRAASRA